MYNTNNKKILLDLETEMAQLEAELARLTPETPVKPVYSLLDTNIISANFNRAADMELSLLAVKSLPRRRTILRRLDYLRRRYHALRQQLTHTAAPAFAA